MKYLLDDGTYEETKNIALGKIQKSPFLMEFSDWCMSTYSIKVLNIKFNELEIRESKRYRLWIIIETTEDYQKMFHGPFQSNKEYKAQISEEFKRMALKYQYASKSQFINMFVAYDDFSKEAKTDANHKAEKEVRAYIKSSHASVWDVVAQFWSTVVFYYSDYDVMNCERTGTSKIITNDYYTILKKHDELDYFTRENINLTFDSKENLDKNFQGNLFYYFR